MSPSLSRSGLLVLPRGAGPRSGFSAGSARRSRYRCDRRPDGRTRYGSEEETAVWIERKGARNRFGRRMAGGCEMSGNGIDRKPCDGVMAAIADIEELP